MNMNDLPRFKSFHFLITCQVPVWAKAFGVEENEIERQIGIAHAWADNNPKKAPKRDVMRYLQNWMQIAEREGSLRRGAKSVLYKDDAKDGDMTPEEMQEIRRRNLGERKSNVSS